jgi:hypothetical protein
MEDIELDIERKIVHKILRDIKYQGCENIPLLVTVKNGMCVLTDGWNGVIHIITDENIKNKLLHEIHIKR